MSAADEDDKAREYFEAICPGGVPWDVKNEYLREAWRKQYRAARDCILKQETR